VFVASIDVRFSSNAHDPVKVVNIDMDKDSIESGQDLLALRLETLGKGDICCDRKQLLVVDLRLHPVHEERDVLRGWKMNWFLVFHPILP